MAEAVLRGSGKASRRRVLAGAGGLAAAAMLPARVWAAAEPIRIGVISENSTLDGAAIPKGAQMAVDEINAKGGVMGRPLQLVAYDDHVSSADAVRAFQRLVSQDKVVMVIASFVSEIALALEPWSARLKMPFVTPGAASDQISAEVHKDYDRFKYTFHAWIPSTLQGKTVADSAHDLLVEQLHMKNCVVMSEDAAWTTPLDAAYLEFLPKEGLEVLDHIRFSPDTTDFTPIYNRIEAKKAEAIIVGMAHVGVVPTVQWAQSRVPIAMYGINAQASSSAFWKDTHGACAGQTALVGAAPDSQITAKTLPFTEGYRKRFSVLPAYPGYSTFDIVFVIAAAIERAKSTAADALVTALEATDYEGTIGRYKFYGRDSKFTHAIEIGADLIPGVMLQWQQEAMKTIWPTRYATAKIAFPSFVKVPE